MNCIIIDHFIAFPPTQACSCFVLYLEFLATQHCSSLPWSITTLMSRMPWEFHHLFRILGIVILLTITIFLGPCVDPDRGTNKWTMLFGFCTSSNPIALKLMVDSSILSLLLIESSFEHWSCYLIQIPGCTLLSLFSCVCFPSSIHRYIIWSDKWYFLVHLIVEIHPLEISMICCWAYQLPPYPFIGLMLGFCFGTRFRSTSPENLTMSSRQFVLHLSS